MIHIAVILFVCAVILLVCAIFFLGIAIYNASSPDSRRWKIVRLNILAVFLFACSSAILFAAA